MCSCEFFINVSKRFDFYFCLCDSVVLPRWYVLVVQRSTSHHPRQCHAHLLEQPRSQTLQVAVQCHEEERGQRSLMAGEDQAGLLLLVVDVNMFLLLVEVEAKDRAKKRYKLQSVGSP